MPENPYQTPQSTQPQTPATGSGQSIYGPVRSLTALATFSKVMLVINIVLVIAVTAYMMSDHYNDWLNSALLGIDNGSGVDERLKQIVGLGVIVFVLSAIAICMWTSKAMANTWAISSQRPTITPGWAAGWYFIPIAWFWKPYEAMSQIWTGAFQHRASKNMLLTWWLCWISSNILDRISSRMDIETDSSVIDVVSAVLTVIAALLLIKIIDKITKYHQTKLSNAY